MRSRRRNLKISLENWCSPKGRSIRNREVHELTRIPTYTKHKHCRYCRGYTDGYGVRVALVDLSRTRQPRNGGDIAQGGTAVQVISTGLFLGLFWCSGLVCVTQQMDKAPAERTLQACSGILSRATIIAGTGSAEAWNRLGAQSSRKLPSICQLTTRQRRLVIHVAHDSAATRGKTEVTPCLYGDGQPVHRVTASRRLVDGELAIHDGSKTTPR